MKKIGIIGCGWLGLHIAKKLSLNNIIYTTTTSENKKNELNKMGYHPEVIQFWDHEISQEFKSWKSLKDLDVIIITVPFSKRTSTKLLKNRFENLSLFIDGFKKQLFLMSSIGVYPQVEMEISEKTLENKHLNPSILFVEELVKEKFPKVNILRLGGLMGGSRVFSNYKISNPNQIVNHVHYEDICLIIEKMIQKNSNSKTYNIVAPLHPTKQAIINYQNDLEESLGIQKNGRRILSKLSEDELNYQYIHTDPRKFK